MAEDMSEANSDNMMYNQLRKFINVIVSTKPIRFFPTKFILFALSLVKLKRDPTRASYKRYETLFSRT